MAALKLVLEHRGATLEVGLPPLHPRGPRARHASVGDVRRWVAAREGVAAADARESTATMTPPWNHAAARLRG